MWVISFTSCLHCMLDLIHMTLILLPGSHCSELGVEPGKDFGSSLSLSVPEFEGHPLQLYVKEAQCLFLFQSPN